MQILHVMVTIILGKANHIGKHFGWYPGTASETCSYASNGLFPRCHRQSAAGLVHFGIGGVPRLSAKLASGVLSPVIRPTMHVAKHSVVIAQGCSKRALGHGWLVCVVYSRVVSFSAQLPCLKLGDLFVSDASYAVVLLMRSRQQLVALLELSSAVNTGSSVWYKVRDIMKPLYNTVG